MQALRTAAAAATVAAMALCGGCAETEYRSSGEVEPTNELPNPYQSTAPWGKLPEGRTWGAMNGVAIDNDGESLWVANRCGANPHDPAGQSPFQYDTCVGSNVPPVMKLDAAGNVLTS